MKKMKKVNDLESTILRKDSLIDHGSTGHRAMRYYYNMDVDEFNAKEKSSDGSIPVNIRINRNDIELIDFISEITGNKRAAILADLVTSDINDMFHCLGIAEKAKMAEIVDAEMSKKNISHIYKGMTWVLEASTLDPNYENPAYQREWSMISKNIKGDGKNE